MKTKITFFFLLFCGLNSFVSCNSEAAKKSKKLSFSEFTFTDIGTNTKPGKSNVKNDRLEMLAGGADIWGTKDEFRFGYKTLKGDFDVSVQILSLTKPNQYTKAGIMARTDLTDISQHVYFQIFPDNTPRNKNNGGCEFQYRIEKGGDMKAIYPNLETAGDKFDVKFPNTYIRLKRVGDVFTSFCSHDNKTWNLYSTFTLKMPVELHVGMAVTSHNSDEQTLAEFANFTIEK